MFPDRKSLVTGIVLCGFGFGSLVFGLIAMEIVNPSNQEIDDKDFRGYENVPKMLRILAGTWAALSIIGIILSFPAPS
jgi:hypothetical protein